jgi:hypothetical protein
MASSRNDVEAALARLMQAFHVDIELEGKVGNSSGDLDRR